MRAEIECNLAPGFITELYSPANETSVSATDRVFYTRRNAIYLDTARQAISNAPEWAQTLLLAPLLSAASIHANTSGVFKGFYKDANGIGKFGGSRGDALSRILAPIEVQLPILSDIDCVTEVRRQEANTCVRQIEPVDVAYFDPPYNQHPYGSNYFMLNLLASYKRPSEISRVSGIPVGWQRSAYNVRTQAADALFDAVDRCPAKLILISYNSEGFVSHDNFVRHLLELGSLEVLDKRYNTFRGCRNLRDRDPNVTEYLFLVDKR